MGAFLPQLVNPVLLVRTFAKAQTLQGFVCTFALQIIDDLSLGERFELAEAFTQVGRLSDEVKMVFQNHVAVQLQVMVGLLITPAVEQVVDDVGTDEQRQPLHDRAGQKMWLVGFGKGVAAAAHGILP
ncbi:hypothetical protein D3C81_1511350 [compost metagenome]